MQRQTEYKQQIEETDHLYPTTKYQSMGKQTKINSQYRTKVNKLAIILTPLFLVFVYIVLKMYDRIQILSAGLKQTEDRLQKVNIKLTSVFKSWQNEEKNKQNLQKINKIKRLASNQILTKYSKNTKQAYLLSMNNYPLTYYNFSLKNQIQQLKNSQYQRLSKIYNFSLPELSFCIVICTVNNSKNYRYEHNLLSVLNQNYTNYKVIIIDDASLDQNYFLLQQLIAQLKPTQKVKLIRNQNNVKKLRNIYKASTEFCQKEDILFTVDGDDELLGVNIFKVFNDRYQTKNLSFAYSDALRSKNDEGLQRGYSRAFTDQQKKDNNYRSVKGCPVFNLVSFKNSNFLKIKIEDFKDDNDQWFQCGVDEVLWPPLLQLSCGNNLFIQEYFYLNYERLGNQQMEVNPQCNKKTVQLIGSKSKYTASKSFWHKKPKYTC